MVDYTRLANTAQRLIDKNGRAITIVKLSRVNDDPNFPWRGNETPRVSVNDTISTIGVFVEPYSLARFGFLSSDDELIKRAEQVVMVSGNGTSQKDLSLFDEIIDFDNTRWKIDRTNRLRPAENTLIYALGVKR